MIKSLRRTYLSFLGFVMTGAMLFTAVAASRQSDLVEVTSINPNIEISLPYATEENFCKKVLYPAERCFLRRAVAESLDRAQKELEKEGYGLKIWDGYRPRSVQYAMWKIIPDGRFVANPKRGSRHNRGAAVDVTLIDFETKEEVEMPTGYDVFNFKAHAYYSKLPKEVLANRARLQRVMRNNGFQVMKTEWWHFDYQNWRKFPLADESLENLGKLADAEKGKGDSPD